ncbi:Leucine-rich repeat-containing protein 1 [Balamuthia mandrillaris]
MTSAGTIAVAKAERNGAIGNTRMEEEDDKEVFDRQEWLGNEVLASQRFYPAVDLSHARLTGLPSAFLALDSIRTLTLDDNHLRSLPEALLHLRNPLLYLSIANNCITDVPAHVLGGLTSLQYLNLDHNELTTIPAELSRLTRLSELSLQHNKLEALPESIGELASLLHLLLGHNQLRSLPPTVGDLPSLTYINVANNPLQALPFCLYPLLVIPRRVFRVPSLSSRPTLDVSVETAAEEKACDDDDWCIPSLFSLCAMFLAGEDPFGWMSQLDNRNVVPLLPTDVKERAKEFSPGRRCAQCKRWLHRESILHRRLRRVAPVARPVSGRMGVYPSVPKDQLVQFEALLCYRCFGKAEESLFR